MRASRLQPAEWDRHQAIWVGWPSHPELWGDNLGGARAEVEDLVRSILFPNDGKDGPVERGEKVKLVASGDDAVAAASIMRAHLPDPSALEIVDAPIGDIWLRDTGPIFVKNASGENSATGFSFNGWGGKYQLAEDHRIGKILAAEAGVDFKKFETVFAEGGALESNGHGAVLTTEQCLLNPNRNPEMERGDIEAVLEKALGARKVIWLRRGLVGDHTDGHIDNIARFVGPNHIVCMRSSGADDPNAEIYEEIQDSLKSASDADGNPFTITTIPSPGRVKIDGDVAAASHLNFVISNYAVIVPVYAKITGDSSRGLEALEILKTCIARQHYFAIDSSNLLTGGGSFHCITQHQPV